MTRLWTAVVMAIGLPPAQTQPRIAASGVVNAAGLAPAGLPGSEVARGSLITIWGTGLGPAQGASWSGLSPAAELAGVSVTLHDGAGVAYPALPVFVHSGQINALIPCEAPAGEASITVNYQGRTSPPSDPVRVVDRNFQIFTRNSKGYGPALAQELFTAEVNGLTRTLAPGRLLALWGTGLGSCGGPPPQMQAWVGGRPAAVLWTWRPDDFPGVDLVLLWAPADAPEGCFVPVVVRSGERYSNVASLAVARRPGACSDALNGFTLLTGRLNHGPITWGRVRLFHGTGVTERPGTVVLLTSAEQADAGFFRSTEQNLWDTLPYPAFGSCLVGPLGGADLFHRRTGAPASAGTLALNGPWEVLAGPGEDGLYHRRLATTPFEDRPDSFLYPGGSYRARAAGEAVGGFTASMVVPEFVKWTNREELPFVLRRTAPITLRWYGGDPEKEFVVIRGFSFDRRLSTGRDFICTAAVGAAQFTLPEWVVAAMPSTQQDFFIAVGSVPLLAAPTFAAPELDAGFFTYEISTGRNFALQ